MAGVGATEWFLLYPSWESIRKRKVLKPDWISSSSVTSEGFVCTRVRPVFPPCSVIDLLHWASFQADRRALEHLALRRRKDTVVFISARQQMEAQCIDPQIQKKSLFFVCWMLSGRLKSPLVLTQLSLSALLESATVAEVIYGEGIQLWLASSGSLDSSDKPNQLHGS